MKHVLTSPLAERAAAKARHDSEAARGLLPTVHLPNPPSYSVEDPPCAACAFPGNMWYAQGYRAFVALSCGHDICSKCSMFRMTKTDKCPVEGCEAKIPEHMRRLLAEQLRAWEVEQGIYVCKDEKYEPDAERHEARIPFEGGLEGVEPNYGRAAAVLQHGPPTTPSTWTEAYIDSTHIRPHIVGFANLAPVVRAMEGNVQPNSYRWRELITAIDNLLLKQTWGLKKWVDAERLRKYLMDNTEKLLNKAERAGETVHQNERDDIKTLIDLIIELCKEKRPWDEAVAAAQKKAENLKAEKEKRVGAAKRMSSDVAGKVKTWTKTAAK